MVIAFPRSVSGFMALLFVASVVSAQQNTAGKSADADWPQFLGPDRSGISREKGLLTAWPKDGPREVWRVAGGVGMSGLADRKSVV